MAKTQSKFFGRPPSGPFTLPGTYITPEGGMSVGGGGGGGFSEDVSVREAEARMKAEREAKATEEQRRKLAEEQRQRDIKRAEDRLQREREANIRRERAAGRVGQGGLTQPERDVIRQERYLEKKGITQKQEQKQELPSRTVIPGSAAAKPITETKGQKALRLIFKGPSGFDIATGQIVSPKELGRRQAGREKAAATVGKGIDIFYKKTQILPETDFSKTLRGLELKGVKTVTSHIIKHPEELKLYVFGGVPSAKILDTGSTKFLAGVTQRGSVSDVLTVTKTRVGKKTIGGVGRQVIKTSDEGISISKGVGIVGRKIKRGVEFTRVDSLGLGKQLGQAKQVGKLIDIPVGKGVTSKTLNIQTGKVIERPGLRIGVKRFSGLSKMFKPSKTEITGVMKPVTEGTYGFVGTTKKPITALTKTGFTKRIPLQDLNVKGLIKVTTPKSDVMGKLFVGTSRSKAITSQVEKSIIGQVGALRSAAIKTAAKPSATRSITAGISGISRPSYVSTRLEPLTSTPQIFTGKSILTEETVFMKPFTSPIKKQVSITSPVSLPKTEFTQATWLGQGYKLGLGSLSKIRTEQKLIPRTAQFEREVLRSVPKLEMGLGQRQKTLVRQAQRQKPFPAFQPSIKIPTPTHKGAFGFPFLLPGQAPSRKGRGKFGVAVRRYGKFRPIGSGLSLSKATFLGQERVSKTLAATYKIIPQTKGSFFGGVRTPFGFTQKKGLLFTEQPKFRLSTKGEVFGIQMARKGERRTKK